MPVVLRLKTSSGGVLRMAARTHMWVQLRPSAAVEARGGGGARAARSGLRIVDLP